MLSFHKAEYKLEAITAHKNKELFLKQIAQFNPKYAVLSGYTSINESFNNTKLLFNTDGIDEVVDNCDYDYALIALVGMIGLKYVLKVLKRGKRVLLANKEAIVAGGKIVINACNFIAQKAVHKKSLIPNAKYADNVDLLSPLNRIIPIDSEHSAIFQCMCANSQNAINRIFLTCSGGPFRKWSKEDIDNATKLQALKHPNWSMGAKISVDSATLFNKALEIIEARYLFNVDYNNISVLIHPESIVHSMVGFNDNSIIAQLGTASMKIPIQYAMSYPQRLTSNVPYPDLCELHFEKPDTKRFRSLELVKHCLKADDASCVVLNASNEVAVEYFLKDKIKFGRITDCVDYTLNTIEKLYANSYDEILLADNRARQIAKTFLEDN